MKKFFLFLVVFLCALNAFATDYKDIIRVGISDNDFSNLYYNTITIGATDNYVVYDKVTQQELVSLPAIKPLKINYENNKLALYSDSLIKSNIENPLGIKTNGFLTVKGLQRAKKTTLYRGEFEIALANKGKFNLINVIPLEEYLKGVVPNEMPVSFGLEALKAQAIVARNYTLRPRTVIYHNFDVCDSVQSQVYFGTNTEHPLATRAIEETKGLFALYNGKLILALYSSTAGGHTENYENVFLAAEGEKAAEHLPYLKGKPDKQFELVSDEDINNFYINAPDSFDINSRFYRWEVEWSKLELEEILKKTLKQNSNSGYISPKFNPECFGNLTDIKILSRGVSGKVISLEILTDKGNYTVKKELIIRKVFQKNSKMLNSANIIIQNSYDDSGNLSNIKFIGGGFGHGVGMSQYGAGYMASKRCQFDDILQHYYTGIAIGTFPTEVSKEKVTQEFYSPNGRGTLIIENPKNVKNFTFIINNVEINLDESTLQEKTCIELDRLIKENNKIEFLPLDDKLVKVWVEVYKPRE